MSEAKLRQHPRARRKLWIALICLALAFFLILMPIFSVVVYDSNFAERYETENWRAYIPSDFDGLQREDLTFTSNKGQYLAGYKYKKDAGNPKGVVVIAHGLGGGGHNSYMNVADYFTSNGYLAFAYDATGTDNSEGKGVGGLPQGVIDLDYALRYVKSDEEYQNLPILLFGHSWGGYSAGSVLNFHPDVAGVVIVSGFDRSTELFRQQGKTMVGGVIDLFMPYVTIYEGIKYGEYSRRSAIDGFEASNAHGMIIHSRDDSAVYFENGYQKFYDAFKGDERFTFVEFEDRGHNYIYNSTASATYRKQINKDYTAYVEANGGEYNASIKAKFMGENLDKNQCYELDAALMGQILQFYNDSL